jgi:putative transposase
VRRQCTLIGLARATLYYPAAAATAANLRLMRLLDEQYTRTPFYGSRRLRAWLRTQGHTVNHKRIERLMRLMGIAAIAPRRQLSRPAPGHRIYPYLLRGVVIDRVDQVWSTDITYIRLRHGFAYLTAIIDWFSRYVLAWELSTMLETEFCVAALEWALQGGCPEIFNTDQGAQFTSAAFTGRLDAAGVRISMDGRGRALDNVFVERLWRSVKYEHVYLYDYERVPELRTGLSHYFQFYNHERLHQALGYRTPAAVYGAGR